MKLYQLHNALSRSIGDPVECTSSELKDGVRYSKYLRGQYLWGAMNDILLKAISGTSSLPHEVQVKVLERMFPSMVTRITRAFPAEVTELAFICTSVAIDNEGKRTVLPTVPSATAARTHYGRNVKTQTPDSTVWRSYEYLMNVGNNAYETIDLIDIIGIKRPPPYEDLSSDEEADTDVIELYEEMWLPEVIRRATIHSLLDSGELGSATQYYPLIHVSSGGA